MQTALSLLVLRARAQKRATSTESTGALRSEREGRNEMQRGATKKFLSRARVELQQGLARRKARHMLHEPIPEEAASRPSRPSQSEAPGGIPFARAARCRPALRSGTALGDDRRH